MMFISSEGIDKIPIAKESIVANVNVVRDIGFFYIYFSK
jgi:hypothetical protein